MFAWPLLKSCFETGLINGNGKLTKEMSLWNKEVLLPPLRLPPLHPREAGNEAENPRRKKESISFHPPPLNSGSPDKAGDPGKSELWTSHRPPTRVETGPGEPGFCLLHHSCLKDHQQNFPREEKVGTGHTASYRGTGEFLCLLVGGWGGVEESGPKLWH